MLLMHECSCLSLCTEGKFTKSHFSTSQGNQNLNFATLGTVQGPREHVHMLEFFHFPSIKIPVPLMPQEIHVWMSLEGIQGCIDLVCLTSELMQGQLKNKNVTGHFIMHRLAHATHAPLRVLPYPLAKPLMQTFPCTFLLLQHVVDS